MMDEYLTIAEAAREFRVLPDTLRTWARRNVVRSHTILRRVYVHSGDVADAERDWRQRGPKTGRRARQRRSHSPD